MIRRFKRFCRRIKEAVVASVIYVAGAVMGVPAIGIVIRVVFRGRPASPGTEVQPV